MNQHRLLSRLLLTATLLLSAFLRFFRLEGQSFWADEGNSVALAARSVREILNAAAADIHPPAYYVLLKGWGSVFGLDETGARSFSALIGVGLVGAIYLLGRKLGGRRVGLMAAALAAVNPFLIAYSQEARMYTLLALCAAATAWALLAFTDPATSPQPLVSASLLFLFTALGLYTHYLFPLHLVTLNLVFLWQQIRVKRQQASSGLHPQPILASASFRFFWLPQFAAAMLFLPWLPAAWRQITTWPAPMDALTASEALRESARLFACGPSPCALPFSLLPILLLLPALWPRPGRSRWLLPGMWLALPLAAMLALRLFTPAFAKFLLLVAPAYLLLLAGGIERIASGKWQVAGRKSQVASGKSQVAGRRSQVDLPTSRETQALPHASRFTPHASRLTLHASRFTFHASRLTPHISHLIFLFLLLFALPPLQRYYFDPGVARDDYRGIAAYLAAVAGPADAVILNAPGQIDVFSQYDHGAAAVYPLPRARPLDPAATRAELDSILASHKRIFVLYWAAEQADPDGVIEMHLAGHSFQAWASWVGNLRFAAYSAEPGPTPVQLPFAPRFGDAIRLDAVGIGADGLTSGDIARVRLHWLADAIPAANYKITLQLLDAASQVVAQVDAEPLAGLRPTLSWQAGETIADGYGLPIPLGTSPGEYLLILAVYDPASGVRLPVHTQERVRDYLPLGVVRIAAPTAPPPAAILPVRYHTSWQAGPFTLLGYDRFKQGYGYAPETPLAPGDLLHLTFFWQADAPITDDYQIEVRLDGVPLGRVPPAGPGYPTSQWEPGIWRGEHTLALPPERATGRLHTLSLHLLDPGGSPIGEPHTLSPRLRY